MRSHGLLIVAFLVLSLVVCGLSAEAEELTNDSRKTAVAVRITFVRKVMIRGHGREFPTQDPATGRSDVFVFSGGEVRRNRSFEIEWSPGSIKIKSIEWLEVYGVEEQQNMEARSSCSCILSPSDSLGSRLNNAYEGLEICLEPGVYELEYYVNIETNVIVRGLGDTPSDVLITCPEYSYLYIYAIESGNLLMENLAFAVPKYSKMSVGAADTAQAALRAIHVEQGSKFEARVARQGTLRVENAILTQATAVQEGRLVVESTVFRGPAHEDKLPTAVWASDEAQVTLLGCEISGYSWGCFLQGSVELEMSNCVLAPGMQESIRIDGSFSGSIIGSSNEIEVSSLDLSAYPWPTGFVKD